MVIESFLSFIISTKGSIHIDFRVFNIVILVPAGLCCIFHTIRYEMKIELHFFNPPMFNHPPCIFFQVFMCPCNLDLLMSKSKCSHIIFEAIKDNMQCTRKTKVLVDASHGIISVSLK